MTGDLLKPCQPLDGSQSTQVECLKDRITLVSRYSSAAQLGSSGQSVQFGGESDLSLDKHVANVCSSGFYWLRQLRRVRRSLDTDSMKMLVYAFVMLMMSRVNYCNAILAVSPSHVTVADITDKCKIVR